MARPPKRGVRVHDIEHAKAALHLESELPEFGFGRLSEVLPDGHGDPVRIEAFSVCICLGGSMELSIGLQTHRLVAGEVVCLLPSHLLQIHGCSEDFDCRVWVLSHTFVRSLESGLERDLEGYLQLERNPILQLDAQEIQLFRNLCEAMSLTRRYAHQRTYPSLVRNQVLSLIGLVGAIQERSVANAPQAQEDRLQAVVRHFLTLATLHQRQARDVRFYADRLGLTPKYLSALVKEATGVPARDWLIRGTILEAKAMLRTSGQSIQQVAAALHFPDQTSFGKYFRRATGLTPREFRLGCAPKG